MCNSLFIAAQKQLSGLSVSQKTFTWWQTINCGMFPKKRCNFGVMERAHHTVNSAMHGSIYNCFGQNKTQHNRLTSVWPSHGDNTMEFCTRSFCTQLNLIMFRCQCDTSLTLSLHSKDAVCVGLFACLFVSVFFWFRQNLSEEYCYCCGLLSTSTEMCPSFVPYQYWTCLTMFSFFSFVCLKLLPVVKSWLNL